jgi:hypothetical protein
MIWPSHAAVGYAAAADFLPCALGAAGVLPQVRVAA